MADYQKPSWCHAPSHTWTLVEIKNGTEIEKHILRGDCTVLGRAADMVQVELAHESCSRQHARIAFDSRGVPWLRDFQSKHGTTVNKKPIPKAAIGRTESMSTKEGSRGVVLFPGDVLQFGASTRLFYVEGPVDFERGAVKALHQQQETQTVVPHPLHIRESDDEVEQTRTLDDNSVPVQHYKAWEALKARRFKQQNLMIENERIEVKGELTEGQKRQLERNTQRIETLQEEIEAMETALHNKIFPALKTSPQTLFSAAFEEDDVEDRADHGRMTRNNDVETEESLVQKWRQRHSEASDHKSTIARAENRLRVLEEQVARAGDEEERFFLQNDVDLAQDIVQRLHEQLANIMSEVKETEKLLRIVNSKIITNFGAGYIGTDPIPSPKMTLEMPPPVVTSSHSTLALTSMPPPSVLPVANSNLAIVRQKAPSLSISVPLRSLSNSNLLGGGSDVACKHDTSMEIPPVKRPRVGPILPPPARTAPPPSGTLAYLAPSSLASKPMVLTIEKKETPANLLLESKKDVWRTPVDQDGSGRTKLNDKFADRY